ncbi:CNH-domain-containing protein [Amylocystis lapponica]|nr:CNH-domain-containing protein [Amylocystis lapponica]
MTVTNRPSPTLSAKARVPALITAYFLLVVALIGQPGLLIAMDRPLGPRQPDKRHAAYESIFGRPTVPHHQPHAPPGYYPEPPQFVPPNAQQYPYYPQQYGAELDRRTSSASRAPSINYPQQQLGPSAFRQSYYPPPAPQHPQPPPQGYPPFVQPNYAQSSSLAPPSVISRARSIGSSPGVIAPQPEEPPDAGLEALTRAGLTPAQAYQAQVYLSSPMGPRARTHKASSGDFRSLPPSAPLSVSSSADLPRLGMNLDADDGRLGLDFTAGSSTPSDPGTGEDSASELPWARYPHRSKPASVRSRISAASGLAPTPEVVTTAPSSSFPPSSPTRPYPLQVDTAMTFAQMGNTGTSTSPASSTVADAPAPSITQGRRSSESSRTLPPPAFRKERSTQDRTRSMSATMTPQFRAMLESGKIPRPPIPSLPGSAGRESPASVRASGSGPRRAPVVYPALLSRVAEAFKERIALGDRVKDGLTYKESFDGREAVDKIAYIIKTTDRNLALLLGRALDAQKFFHAVTYDHRLRDSSSDLYQFRTKLPSPFVSGDIANVEEDGDGIVKPLGVLSLATDPTPSAESDPDKTLNGSRPNSPSPPDSVTSPTTTRPRQGSVSADDVPLPSGVFTLLTDCYSPTCSRDRLCYSIACPRRLEQQARLNMKPQPGLKKQISRESLGDLVEPGTLWIHTVPQEVVNSVSDLEKKRQEAINEVMYTERDFVRDMEYLRDLWIKPLRESDIIPEERRTDFLEQVFWNIHEIIAVNTRLRDALNKRQKAYAVVEQIGDVLLEAVPHFGPFVSYGAHQLYGKYEFEKEKSSNPAFAQFVEVVEIVRGFLKAVNAETGKAENRFNLLQLDQQLIFRPGEQVDLRLKEEGRELVYKGALKKRGGGQGDSGELQMFLFDHALLMVKPKSKVEQYKVYRRPIPLELLLVSAPDDPPTGKGQKERPRQTLVKNAPHAPVVTVKDGKGGFSITFVHLGRKYYQMTLWASTYVSQRKWVENIQKQQDLMRQRSNVFETVTLSEGFFVGVNQVNCAAPFSQGRRAVYGTDDGVYLSNLWEHNREPVKVLALKDVVQVDVLEEYELLIVLSERQVITFPLDALDPRDPMAGLKRAKRIASHINFFKAGVCLGKTLVCVVKASPLSSTIKTLEPIDQNVRGRSKPTFRKLLQGGNDTLRVFKEFYIPVHSSSIHFLKTKLCVGCTSGFEIVDLETLDTQGLLDPADQSLEFVRKRENIRPLAIYRIDNEFLLCYDEFAFYVNRTGWRSRKDFMVYWEGYPTGFAFHYPYVLAFEPTFVEIRHVETGSMSQIIQGNNLRCVFADTPPRPITISTTKSTSAGGNGFGSSPQVPYLNPYQSRAQQSGGRDEILMVSDDRVMRLQMCIPAQ